jgi:hypothetical protein
MSVIFDDIANGTSGVAFLDALNDRFNALKNGHVAKRKTADQTSIIATATDCADLTFAIGAGETWAFAFDIAQSCDNTGGVKFALTAPSGATLTANVVSCGAAIDTPARARITASGTLTIAFNTFANATNAGAGGTRITGTVFNDATAGNVTLQFAAGTATQTATVWAGASVVAHKVS